MSVIDLSQLNWTLRGWRPFIWRIGKTQETGAGTESDVGPIPATIPNSVQFNLLKAGLIADWNVGLRSRDCEWVEHRHWDFTAVLPQGLVAPGQTAILEAEGLDYSGWILVDGKEVGRFSGALAPHRFDVTHALKEGAHQLSIVFEEPPREQGQFGYTSRSRFFKPRYNYSWDWSPRIVPIGVWDRLTLRLGAESAFGIQSLRAALDADLSAGSVEASIAVDQTALHAATELVLTLCDGSREVGRTVQPLTAPQTPIALSNLPVEPWWPNGQGDQKLYRIHIAAVDTKQHVVWEDERTVGFRTIRWEPCADAPEGAEPWICVVNGKPVFLQGANWVPPRSVYHDSTREEYQTLVELYRDMGCTCLRVWGGGIIEREDFYRACDECGILVWQEFPLSSSGLENAPPSAPEAIECLCTIARSYIQRRAHHASLLLWCGGNELTINTDGAENPADYSHPCLSALRAVVEEHDPGRRFIPTSPSGPLFYAHREQYGKGIHHDIHGPWGMSTFADVDAWKAYWAEDDALFRSEVGMPGAASLEHIERYAGTEKAWPPEGAYWMHIAAWWTQWARFKDALEGKSLADYVALTQRDQAEAYAVAAASCRERFPRCGGFIIWMGHDCFPCPANNSVIDFDRQPKPAYFALKKVFRQES